MTNQYPMNSRRTSAYSVSLQNQGIAQLCAVMLVLHQTDHSQVLGLLWKARLEGHQQVMGVTSDCIHHPIARQQHVFGRLLEQDSSGLVHNSSFVSRFLTVCLLALPVHAATMMLTRHVLSACLFFCRQIVADCRTQANRADFSACYCYRASFDCL